MKRIALAAIAMSLLAIPAAQAQHRPAHPHHPGVHRPAVPPHAVKRHHWSKGQKFGDWRRYRAVNDYHRYGLHRPARGQHWVKVGNDYLLIGAATGMIAAIVAGR
ncbi:MAG TPA: RcnB family protein [Xanthobacteraceae bacterium]|nr:RcnB family protein [Xanthobacteraceae bacterium]